MSADHSLSAGRADEDAEDVDVTGVDLGEIVATSLSDENAATTSKTPCLPLPVAQLTDEASVSPPCRERHASCTAGDSVSDSDIDSEHWSIEEKDRLFQFVAKVFLTNFPLYIALKHCIHSSLEDLSKHDASALNNYCELSVNLC